MANKVPPFIRLYNNIKQVKSGCWEWQGNTGSSGYGQIKAFGKMKSCHVLSYELYHGEILKGYEVSHSCHNKLCINPDHLRLLTHYQNIREMIDSGRRVQGKSNPRKGIKNKQSKPVYALGKKYGSINEAEAALKTGNGTVSYWIKNSPKKAYFISREEYLNG